MVPTFEIQRLIAMARTRLTSWGSFELPAWPGVLPRAWMHPDFFFRLFGEDEFDCFCFQPASSRSSSRRTEELGIPSLVWMHKPFTNTWMGKQAELWIGSGDASLPHQEVAFEAVASRQEFVGLPQRPEPFSESGPLWGMSWLGQQIGEIRIISRICGEDLARPTGIAVFDLAALARFGDPEKRFPIWGGGFHTGNLLAWKARSSWELPEGDLTARNVQPHWERLRERIEACLTTKQLTEAYLVALEAVAFLRSLERGAVSESFRASCDAGLRAMLKKLPALMPRRTSGSRAVRDGVLR